MGGLDAVENSDGTVSIVSAFEVARAVKFHPFTLYLMGLMPKEEVPPILYITNKEDRPFYLLPKHLKVTKKWISIDDLIAVEGERVPNYSTSQKNFKIAVILVTEQGKQVDPQAIILMNGIVSRISEMWANTTGGRSTMTIGL